MDFESLMEQYKNPVEALVHYRVGNRSDAEDVLQEVWMSAYEKWETLRDPEAVKSWLIRIAQNKINDHYRQRKRLDEVALDAELEDTLPDERHYGGLYAHDPDRLDLMKALGKLSERDREILTLFYLQDLSQKEIAARLQIAPGTVKSRVYYAKQHLQKEMQKNEFTQNHT